MPRVASERERSSSPPPNDTAFVARQSKRFPLISGIMASSEDLLNHDHYYDARGHPVPPAAPEYGTAACRTSSHQHAVTTAITTDSSSSSSSSSDESSVVHRGFVGTLFAASRASANVAKTFIFNILDGAAFSLWQQTVFQQFVFDLSGQSNAVVGFMSGATGVAQVISGVLGSALADKKLRRQTVMRCASVMGFAGAALTAYGTYARSLPFLYAASVGWGGYLGLGNPAVEALFADSVSTIHRTTVYTLKWMSVISSYLVGYALTLILFWQVGDEWHMREMALVMYCGLGLHCTAFSALWFLWDRDRLIDATDPPRVSSVEDVRASAPTSTSRDCVPDAAAADHPSATPLQGPSQMRTFCDGCHSAMDQSVMGSSVTTECLCPTCWTHGHDQAASESARSLHQATPIDTQDEPLHAAAPPTEANSSVPPFPQILLTTHGIPYFICFGDFLASFGSGMTLRFFPLFFIQTYGVSPFMLTLIFAITTVVTTITASLVKLAATKVFRNRVVTAMMCRLIGAACMVFLARAEGFLARLVPMVIVFVIRMSIMNSIFGITRSVVMDHVPASQRARWSAVESLTSFTWAGSAVLGGLIVDAHGFRSTFAVTAAIHTVAALVLLPAARMIRDGVFKEAPSPSPSARAEGALSPKPAEAMPLLSGVSRNNVNAETYMWDDRITEKGDSGQYDSTGDTRAPADEPPVVGSLNQ